MRRAPSGVGVGRALAIVLAAACCGPEYGSIDEASSNTTSVGNGGGEAGSGDCGNGVVDPRELCDGVGCDPVTCEPTEQSDCFGGSPLTWGTKVALPSTPNAASYPSCGGVPTAALGYLDTGDSPTRIFRRSVATTSLRMGCDPGFPAGLLGCSTESISDELPAHSIVWIGGPSDFATGQATLELQRVRFGSLFDEAAATDPEAFDPGGSAWTLLAGAWILNDVVTEYAALESPPVDGCGLPSPTIRIRHALQAIDDVTPNLNQLARLQVVFDPSTGLSPLDVRTWSAAFDESKTEESTLPPIDPAAFCAGPIVLRFVVDVADGPAVLPVNWQIDEVFFSEPFAD